MNDLKMLIIPCLNCYKTLNRTIRSIQNQIYKNYKILSDDLSSDNSMDIEKDLAKINKRIKIIENERNLVNFFLD